MSDVQSIAAGSDKAAPGWLRGQRFDLFFVVGIAAIALASGWAVTRDPKLFWPILFADLWLLGYHHVVATYTRLLFNAEGRREHRFLIIWLPLIVIALVASLAFGVGLWVLASVYLYWQWFHYTRQSWGIAQVYRRKEGELVVDGEWFSKIAFYSLPIWGILYRSNQDPGAFLGLELRVIPVPDIVVEVSSYIAVAALLWWLGTRFVMWWRGRLPVAHTMYMLSHLAIFYVAYIAIRDLTHGWLVINIWHNAQYILFVWLYNNSRFKDGVQPESNFLSTISQARNAWIYFLICFGLSTVIYVAVNNIFTALAVVPLVVVYQSINFHHYIVDSVIWKVRRKKMQQTLGITT